LSFRQYITSVNIVLAVLIAGLFFYGNIILFNMVYLATFLFLSFRTVQSTARRRIRFTLISAYLVIMALQMTYYSRVAADIGDLQEHPIRKLFAIAILLLPMILSRYVATGKYAALHLPSIHETSAISFAQMRESAASIRQAVARLEKTGDSLSLSNFKRIIEDLPRHDSFHYVNAGSLTGEYFQAAEASLNDPGLYIVISDTGTPASEVLSVFTRRQFNHASLSFDASLETIVSYNGGERVYPPGLNREMLAFFNARPDASILIYRLPVTCEQKKAALDKIMQINEEGSAYNLLGLLLSQSYKPNIMYCSQFVYNIIGHIGASYFESPGIIKPTDLIEKDYHRKLEFVEELRLNTPSDSSVPAA